MKAVVYRYGSPDAVEVREVERPALKESQVLVRVRAASINMYDLHFLHGGLPIRMMAGLLRPKNPIMGADLAGVVEQAGPAATRFKPGDEVFGQASGAAGAFAEFAPAAEKSLALKPAGMSFEAAAAMPMAGVTALQGLRDHGQIQPGQRVLVTGASGGVGSFAVLLAKAFGAQAIALCSPQKAAYVRSLGADEVIDPTRADVTRGGGTFDLVLDVYANRPPGDYRRALAPQGRYVLAGGDLPRILQLMLTRSRLSRPGGQTFTNFLAQMKAADLETLAGLFEAGKLSPPVDRAFPLEQAVEALRRVEGRQAHGKVVIVMDGGS